MLRMIKHYFYSNQLHDCHSPHTATSRLLVSLFGVAADSFHRLHTDTVREAGGILTKQVERASTLGLSRLTTDSCSNGQLRLMPASCEGGSANPNIQSSLWHCWQSFRGAVGTISAGRTSYIDKDRTPSNSCNFNDDINKMKLHDYFDIPVYISITKKRNGFCINHKTILLWPNRIFTIVKSYNKDLIIN
jgi:hypothetical protein